MGDVPLIVAGGIVEGRGSAACLALRGLGTRFLASKEANITQGYDGGALRTNDGGRGIVRTSVYGTLRGTELPRWYIERGMIN